MGVRLVRLLPEDIRDCCRGSYTHTLLWVVSAACADGSCPYDGPVTEATAKGSNKKAGAESASL